MANWAVRGEPRPPPGDDIGQCPSSMSSIHRVGQPDGYNNHHSGVHFMRRDDEHLRKIWDPSQSDLPAQTYGHQPRPLMALDYIQAYQGHQAQDSKFTVIREQQSSPAAALESPFPFPIGEGTGVSPASSCAMERTASGLSISSDTTVYTTSTQDDAYLIDDKRAAWLVERHLDSYRRRANGSRHQRILRSLTRPRSRHAEFSIDDAALESIFSAANEIFFRNRLSRRVKWDWSHESSPQYRDHIIGTTVVRRSRLLGGFETLIVLSQPILSDAKYNRRLLISTFLHELIHSYLFVCCGFEARLCGGHTPGFRRIAQLIDHWAGPDTLHLQNMEADLDDFKQPHEHQDEQAFQGPGPVLDMLDSIPRPFPGAAVPPVPLSLHPENPDHDYRPVTTASRYHSQAGTRENHIPTQYSSSEWEWDVLVQDRKENIGHDMFDLSTISNTASPASTVGATMEHLKHECDSSYDGYNPNMDSPPPDRTISFVKTEPDLEHEISSIHRPCHQHQHHYHHYHHHHHPWWHTRHQTEDDLSHRHDLGSAGAWHGHDYGHRHGVYHPHDRRATSMSPSNGSLRDVMFGSPAVR